MATPVYDGSPVLQFTQAFADAFAAHAKQIGNSFMRRQYLAGTEMV